ncbi:MAG TPA: glycosyltransferase family 4 protein [Syntrophales bacterium]|nr:glycosyltransferase family 4 protein [Syntrophales bacterium]
MKRKILVISPYNPFAPILGAAEKGLYYRIKNLATLADVTLLSFAEPNGQGKKIAADHGVTAHLVSNPLRNAATVPSRLARLRRLLTGRLELFQNIHALTSGLASGLPVILKDQRFDLIHIDDVIIAPISRHLPREPKKLLFFHNLMTLQHRNYCRAKREIQKELAARIELFWVYLFEKRILREFPNVVVLTDVEKKKAAFMSPATNVVQIPLEIDPEEYRPSSLPTDARRVTLSGTMSYEPNHEAALHFIRDVLPGIRSRIDDVKFYVVGKSPRDELLRLHDGHVVITGKVDDIRESLSRAGVVVAPILSGGGMRFKILESFALSKAVVSTSLGAEGIDYTDGKDIMIADTAQAFADSVCMLLENRGECERLGRNARLLIEERYAVPQVWARWRQVYSELGIS